MTSLQDLTQETIVVPVELVQKCCGLALDFGGSILKAIYRSKQNLEDAKSKDSGFGELQLVRFLMPEIDNGLDFIKTNVQLGKGKDDEKQITIFTTGLGCTQHGKRISERLGFKVENQVEFDCFVKGFSYLATHLSRGQFFEPYETEAGLEPFESIKEQIEIMKASMTAEKSPQLDLSDINFSADPMAALGRVINDSSRPVAEVEDDLFPCMLVMCGSGFGFMIIKADGTYKLADGSNRGGRCFYGLGSLLTGCKTFDELIDLASKGNAKNVSSFSDSLLENTEAAEGDESLYVMTSKSKCSSIVYCFGKCTGKKLEDFKKEDLARAILEQVILDTVQTVSLCAMVHGIKRVVFCGSFVNTQFVRNRMTKEFVYRNLFITALGKPPLSFDFIKHSGHLGAIGALVTNFVSSETKENNPA